MIVRTPYALNASCCAFPVLVSTQLQAVQSTYKPVYRSSARFVEGSSRRFTENKSLKLQK